MRITHADFASALVAALTLRGIAALELSNRFDEACATTTDWLIEQDDTNVRFRIMIHPVYGDSLTVQDRVLPFLYAVRLAHIRMPYDGTLYFNYSSAQAEGWLTRHPEWEGKLAEMGEIFMDAYYGMNEFEKDPA